MKKKRKSRFTAEDWARSDRVREMLAERIAHYDRLIEARERAERKPKRS